MYRVPDGYNPTIASQVYPRETKRPGEGTAGYSHGNESTAELGRDTVWSKPKRGRPPQEKPQPGPTQTPKKRIANEARKEQMRLAQRACRSRRTEYTKSLEERVQDLETRLGEQTKLAEHWQMQVGAQTMHVQGLQRQLGQQADWIAYLEHQLAQQQSSVGSHAGKGLDDPAPPRPPTPGISQRLGAFDDGPSVGFGDPHTLTSDGEYSGIENWRAEPSHFGPIGHFHEFIQLPAMEESLTAYAELARQTTRI